MLELDPLELDGEQITARSTHGKLAKRGDWEHYYYEVTVFYAGKHATFPWRQGTAHPIDRLELGAILGALAKDVLESDAMTKREFFDEYGASDADWIAQQKVNQDFFDLFEEKSLRVETEFWDD